LKPLKFLPALLLFLAFLAPGSSFAGDAVYYLFRHAEKAVDPGNRDPALTDEGQARAAYLSGYLKGEGVTRIFSSDYIRTRDTVAPLAAAAGLEIEIYDPRDLPGFAEQLKSLDGVIVVSGHSNTTPELTALLSGFDTTPMDETEYDRLYKLVFSEDNFVMHVLTQDVSPE